VPASYCDGIARMAEFLASIVSDSGDLAFLGDDDGGRFFSPYGARSRFARGTLATASLLIGKCFISSRESDLAEIALWWLGPERCAGQLPGTAPRTSNVFPGTGIVVMRRGAVDALFDAGPFGPGSAGHSHSDTLSLVVRVGEREVVIDSGTFSYMDPEWRDIFRGSAAHNTVRIDAHDQASAARPFRWTKKPEVKLLEFASDHGRDRAVASCAYHGFIHTRTIEFANHEFSIVDHIGGLPGEHDIEQYWHFAQTPREWAPGLWDIDDVATFSVDGGVVEQGWRSRCFGSKEPSAVMVVRRRSTLPVTLRAELRIKP